MSPEVRGPRAASRGTACALLRDPRARIAQPRGGIRSIGSRAPLLALTVFVLAAGCGGPPSADDESTLRILYATDEGSLYPGSDDVPKHLFFLSFVGFESSGDSQCGSPRPELADRWEHSPDWREWTLYLRKEVRWHDGVPVTAHDVKFTVELWAHPEVRHWAAAGIDSVAVLDDHTLRLFYSRPSREPLNGWDVYYPRHRLAQLDPGGFWDWEFWMQPVGNGPYRYVRHVPKTMTEVEANPDYFPGAPRIRRIVLKWGGGNPAMELQGGSVDAVEGIGGQDAARLRGDPRFRVYYVPLPGAVRIYWNHRSPLFREASVRRALTLVLDRRELHRVLGYPEDLPLTDGVYTRCQFARGELAAPWPHDPEAARRLLEEAGWRHRDGEGTRERDGTEFSFRLILPNDWLEAPRAAVFLQDQLRAVGVRMEVESLDGRVVQERLRGGDFEAAISITNPSAASQESWFGARSPLGYENPRVAELLERAAAAMEPEAQDRIYGELAEIFRAEVPATYLYPKVDAYAVHRRVRGFSPELGDLIMSADRLWVEERER